HPDVHQHDIRLQLVADPHRLGAVAGGAQHREVRLGAEQFGEPGTDDLVIVRDHDPDGRGRAAHPGSPLPGRVAQTTNPPPAASPVLSSPPTAAARSRIPSSPWPPSGRTPPDPAAPGPLSRITSCSR